MCDVHLRRVDMLCWMAPHWIYSYDERCATSAGARLGLAEARDRSPATAAVQAIDYERHASITFVTGAATDDAMLL